MEDGGWRMEDGGWRMEVSTSVPHKGMMFNVRWDRLKLYQETGGRTPSPSQGGEKARSLSLTGRGLG